VATDTSAAVAPELQPNLRAILGDALGPGEPAYTVDGLVPRFVATPSSVDQLAAVLAAADEAGAAVVPWGAGRHMSLGNVPTRYDIALRATVLDRVLEYEPADLTVTVEAGITLGKLQATLAEHGQFLPIDAPPDATVGGVLAANVSGPSRHAYGLPRDWLIGIRVAHADGSVSKGGGRVVKNVAGYDMPKLYVGSLGTLGVIVEATFKVAPLPVDQRTLLIRCSTESAAELSFAADDRGLALRAVALLDRADGRCQAAFWLAGPAAAVERTSRELLELAATAETQRLEGEASDSWWAARSDPLSDQSSMVLRASLLPSAVAGFMRLVQSLRDEAGLSTTVVSCPTTGLVRWQLEAEVEQAVGLIEEARRAAAAAGGSVVVEAAPVEVKERVDVWGDPSAGAGAGFGLTRRLKEQFDPRSTLNPGRYVGGL